MTPVFVIRLCSQPPVALECTFDTLFQQTEKGRVEQDHSIAQVT